MAFIAIIAVGLRVWTVSPALSQCLSEDDNGDRQRDLCGVRKSGRRVLQRDRVDGAVHATVQEERRESPTIVQRGLPLPPCPSSPACSRRMLRRADVVVEFETSLCTARELSEACGQVRFCQRSTLCAEEAVEAASRVEGERRQLIDHLGGRARALVLWFTRLVRWACLRGGQSRQLVDHVDSHASCADALVCWSPQRRAGRRVNAVDRTTPLDGRSASQHEQWTGERK
eukprot:CAMPEP_0113264628 /NCGR_PEP_ID=MMETSP0008_2-20120614/19073_1 /TAXON_ID=97485 /ORGANISM="Prymnesium parvum" /LENGTH=228 /DNA_ID=CAMNT_0000113399 /DNA_START=71 /DNA_END=755 /DNA_ORIENTATION=+ /assembly_acc=CAM_ASM_000153